MDSSSRAGFLNDYNDYVRKTLIPTRNEIKKMFKYWKDPNYWAPYARRTRFPAPSPIQRAISRIKRPESVVDKIFRKPGDFLDGLSLESVRGMHDAVAARVVVYFLAGLPLIDREFRESEFIEISDQHPPVAYLSEELAHSIGLGMLHRDRKDSGYASIHYIVRFRASVLEGPRPWFEIQVRTLAEDLWGEIEHVLGYKPEKRTSFAVRKQFKILSKELAVIDEHFNFLFEELSRFQEEVKYADNHPLNAENLPSVLDDLGIGCAQKEIDGLLKLLASRGFLTAGDLTKHASGKTLDIVRGTFRRVEGREPGNFEVVAGIAAVRGKESESEIATALEEQIAFLDVWLKLKKEF